MKIETIRHLFTFIILCLAQVLVFNHVTLLGCATPLLYVYFIMMFRRDFPNSHRHILRHARSGRFVSHFPRPAAT